MQVSPSDSLSAPHSSTSRTSSTTHVPCCSTTSPPSAGINGAPLSAKPEISSHSAMGSAVVCSWVWPQALFPSPPRWLRWDSSTLDGQLTSEVSSTAIIASWRPFSPQQWSAPPPECYWIWLLGLITLIRPSPRSYRRDTKIGSMPSSGFPSKRALTTSSRTPSHSTSSTSSAPSLPSSASTSSLTRSQSSGETLTCPFFPSSSPAHSSEPTSVLSSPIPSQWLLGRWWTSGPRREVILSVATTARLQSIPGSTRTSSASTLDSSSAISGTSLLSTLSPM